MIGLLKPCHILCRWRLYGRFGRVSENSLPCTVVLPVKAALFWLSPLSRACFLGCVSQVAEGCILKVRLNLVRC